MSVNGALNIMKRFGSASLRLTSDFALSALMDQSTADSLTALTGKGKNLRFVEAEIKLISKLFDTMVSNKFTPVLKFSRLKDKDSGSSLVSEIEIENDLRIKLDVFYKLRSGRYFLVLRKDSKVVTTTKELPPILQFLEKTFQIVFDFVYIDISDYSRYSNTNSMKKLPGTGTFVTFFDVSRTGNKILFNANAFLKQEKMSTITSEGFINDLTVKKLLTELINFVNPYAPTSPFNSNNIRETNQDDPNDFELLALFKQIQKTGNAKSKNELNFLSGTILETVVKKFAEKKDNSVKLTVLTIKDTAVLKFEHKVPSVIRINPILTINLKNGECKFIFRNKEKQLKSQIINSQKNSYKELFENTLGGTYKEVRANKEFVEFVSNVLEKLNPLPKQAMSDFFNKKNREIDDFELLDLLNQIKEKGKITSADPIRELLPDILSAVRDQFRNPLSTASNSNTFIRTMVNNTRVNFEFKVRNNSVTFTPYNELKINLKTGECQFFYKDTDGRNISHPVTKYKTAFTQLVDKIVDGKFNESKSTKLFISYIITVLNEVPQRGRESLESIF